MHPNFVNAIKSLNSSFERLLAMEPAGYRRLPKNMPKPGVYLFSEGGNHLYVGRSKDIRKRYGRHHRPSAKQNMASFAFLLARETTGLTEAAYNRPGKHSRKDLMKIPEFADAFEDVKARIKTMHFRFVEETDQTRQALLEIYCAVVLETPYNSFATH